MGIKLKKISHSLSVMLCSLLALSVASCLLDPELKEIRLSADTSASFVLDSGLLPGQTYSIPADSTGTDLFETIERFGVDVSHLSEVTYRQIRLTIPREQVDTTYLLLDSVQLFLSLPPDSVQLGFTLQRPTSARPNSQDFLTLSRAGQENARAIALDSTANLLLNITFKDTLKVDVGLTIEAIIDVNGKLP